MFNCFRQAHHNPAVRLTAPMFRLTVVLRQLRDRRENAGFRPAVVEMIALT